VPPHGLAGQVAHAGEVEPLDELGVDLPLQLVVVLAAPGAAAHARAGQPRQAAAVVAQVVELRDPLLKPAHRWLLGVSSRSSALRPREGPRAVSACRTTPTPYCRGPRSRPRACRTGPG